jgi:hypothetical protein
LVALRLIRNCERSVSERLSKSEQNLGFGESEAKVNWVDAEEAESKLDQIAKLLWRLDVGVRIR